MLPDFRHVEMRHCGWRFPGSATPMKRCSHFYDTQFSFLPDNCPSERLRSISIADSMPCTMLMAEN
jgi:hypothetical protein